MFKYLYFKNLHIGPDGRHLFQVLTIDIEVDYSIVVGSAMSRYVTQWVLVPETEENGWELTVMKEMASYALIKGVHEINALKRYRSIWSLKDNYEVHNLWIV